MAESINTGAAIEEHTAAPEGHDQKMIESLEKKQGELNAIDAPKEAPQEKILGKFENQEALEKAYVELEKKLGQQKAETQQPENKPVSEMTEKKAAELIKDANIDLKSIANHYYQSGEITEEHYAELEKAGIGKQYVDQYLRGVEAESEKLKEQLYEDVGGEETFQAISQWALSNLSEQELNAYNKAVDSGNVEEVKFAVMSMAYKYEKAMGLDPQLVGGNGHAKGGDVFESVAQLTEAMKDPRYHNDPAYRASVEQKLQRSSIL